MNLSGNRKGDCGRIAEPPKYSSAIRTRKKLLKTFSGLNGSVFFVVSSGLTPIKTNFNWIFRFLMEFYFRERSIHLLKSFSRVNPDSDKGGDSLKDK